MVVGRQPAVADRFSEKDNQAGMRLQGSHLGASSAAGVLRRGYLPNLLGRGFQRHNPTLKSA